MAAQTHGQPTAEQDLEFGFCRISKLQKKVLLTSLEGILDGMLLSVIHPLKLFAVSQLGRNQVE